MTKVQAQVFARKVVPEGAFNEKEAQEWCDFLNYILESETFAPVGIKKL